MGVICLAASIEKWNLHKRIALRMVMVAGAKPGMSVVLLLPDTFNADAVLEREMSSLLLLQAGAGVHVLHGVSVHVAQQHVHHGHGDADSGGRPPAADLYWSGRLPRWLRNRRHSR